MIGSEITVSELIGLGYPLVYGAAVDVITKQGRRSSLDETINRAIIWHDTPEGSNFWAHINSGEFRKAEELHPHLFVNQEEVSKNGFAVKINGLFRK